jgi:hypothetical protein
MVARNGIATADRPATPLRSFARDIAGRVSTPTLASTAVAALAATWAIARYAPQAWLGGVIAYSIAAAALAALTDRRIAMLDARSGSHESSSLAPLRVIRSFVTGLAVASAIAFVLFGAGTFIGSIGIGG